MSECDNYDTNNSQSALESIQEEFYFCDSDIQLIDLTPFTSKTRQFINDIFREEQNVEPEDFSHIYEDITHDGYDAEGPCSNLIDLFITIWRPNSYYYFFYHAEEWYTPNEVVEYKLTDSFTSNCYDPIIYNQTDWYRVKDDLTPLKI